MKERSKLFLTVLRLLQQEGVLDELILIGSWCHYFYKVYFQDTPEIPLVRTLDLDFLVPSRSKIRREANIPEILKRLGFEPVPHYPSGYIKFEHPDISIEFLVPELGAGRDKPYDIEKLHINAQGLRFLTLLRNNLILIRHGDIAIKVPEPSAYVIHKFIIGRRRKNKEKSEKDLRSAKEIGEFLLTLPKERKKLKEVFKSLPGKWQAKIIQSTKSISSELNEFLAE